MALIVLTELGGSIAAVATLGGVGKAELRQEQNGIHRRQRKRTLAWLQTLQIPPFAGASRPYRDGVIAAFSISPEGLPRAGISEHHPDRLQNRVPVPVGRPSTPNHTSGFP